MAGVKGRSGGPRKNSGGARPGAGRKPKNSGAQKSANKPPGRKKAVEERLEPQPHGGALKRSESKPVPAPNKMDMLELLQQVALGYIEASDLQVRAAIAAVQYTHAKKGEGGKKDEKQKNAQAVANKFASAPAPLKLVKP